MTLKGEKSQHFLMHQISRDLAVNNLALYFPVDLSQLLFQP